MYLYICGSVGGRWALMLPTERSKWEAMRAMLSAPNPTKKFVFQWPSAPPLESLNSIRTYVRFVCEWDHRGSAKRLGGPEGTRLRLGAG